MIPSTSSTSSTSSASSTLPLLSVHTSTYIYTHLHTYTLPSLLSSHTYYRYLPVLPFHFIRLFRVLFFSCSVFLAGGDNIYTIVFAYFLHRRFPKIQDGYIYGSNASTEQYRNKPHRGCLFIHFQVPSPSDRATT